MKKYNKKLIFDYVNGNDIKTYSIEELENDCEFMRKVIEVTNDQKMYNLCSDKIKNNYEFIKFMIMKFNDDKPFICQIANEYLEKRNEDDIEYKELIILMGSYCSNIYNNDLFSYATKALVIYNEEKLETALCLMSEKDEYWKKEYGMGFIFVLEEYSNSEIIKNFFAKNFIREIFYENKCNFEELIHSNVKDYKSIKEIGINTFLINFIRKYDNNLANYVCCHLNLLNKIKEDIKRVENNWNNYLDNLNERRIEIIYQEVKTYLEERELVYEVNNFKIIYLAVEKLGLKKFFEKNYNFNYLMVDFDEFEELNKEELNVAELRCLKFTINLIKDLFKKDIVENKEYECKDVDNKMGKILILQIDKMNTQ